MALKKTKKMHKAAGLSSDTRNMVMLTGNPIWRALAKSPVSAKTQTTIGLASRKALYALTNGYGQFENFNELLVTGYAAIGLAEQGYGKDLLREFNAALVSILTCRLRAINGEAYGLSEEEAQSIEVLLELHEQQVQLAGKAELAAAIIEGYKRAK